MSTDIQIQRSYQKQPTIFENRKTGLKKKWARYTVNPGLGFRIPYEAMKGNYVDKKCPFTGNVSVFSLNLTLEGGIRVKLNK